MQDVEKRKVNMREIKTKENKKLCLYSLMHVYLDDLFICINIRCAKVEEKLHRANSTSVCEIKD